MDQKLNIGVSACLMGQEVRFNGGHCQNHFLRTTVAEYASFFPTCPEVAIGMGIPRETVRLEYDENENVRMRAPKSGEDYTETMNAYAKDWSDQLDQLDLDGFVFTKNSPSCGVFRVKIYKNDQPAERRGTGLFAKAIMDKFPELPVEEDGRLSDPVLRESFITRIFAFRRVKDLFFENWTRKDVIEFHSREKYLLMAHCPKTYRELGRVVGNMATYTREEFHMIYLKTFMTGINNKASKGRHHNALTHMAGYLKNHLSKEGRQELANTIDSYRQGFIPLSVPMTLISHMLRRFNENYLLQQTYLSPHPHEMALRNHS
ncbi:conserved hypothetical protein [Candidatus Terasakiella magnetica]|uniref:DUF1722 domain-containing protein n=1 Tax=Candidatus Terasakiella magnetica TaxID=1867952 RepID=A0A1C3RH25_9PROT|nr:DUF523 and DUF1722 domain-containing protein [Candidatus Terasakiella magnetica]SCA56560.1 conserved hypothetical protein [Candidatus Terasakiella magnetica]